MPTNFERKAKALARDLETEIKSLEKELAGKKEVLSRLIEMGGGGKGRTTTRRGRRPLAETVGKTPTRRRKGATGRRKSKNRDIILKAASGFTGKFKLHELHEKIASINPKFGGTHPLGTILSVLKTTPEIKRVKRGIYKLMR